MALSNDQRVAVARYVRQIFNDQLKTVLATRAANTSNPIAVEALDLYAACLKPGYNEADNRFRSLGGVSVGAADVPWNASS